MNTVDERVAAGVALLDEHDPGWWEEDVPNAIDLDTLRLQSLSKCVLGQRCPLEVLINFSPYVSQADRYTAYSTYLRKRDEGDRLQDWWTRKEIIAWAEGHGFTYAWNDQEGWGDLTLAWHMVISERRKLAAEASQS